MCVFFVAVVWLCCDSKLQADDGLGLIIIAIFYPNQHHPFVGWWLLSVLAGMLISLGLRKSGCMKWHPYILLGGIPCWLGDILGSRL